MMPVSASSPGISTPSRPSGHVRHDSNSTSGSSNGSGGSGGGKTSTAVSIAPGKNPILTAAAATHDMTPSSSASSFTSQGALALDHGDANKLGSSKDTSSLSRSSSISSVSSSSSLRRAYRLQETPHIPAPVSPNTTLSDPKSQDDFSGFTPGGPVPKGFSFLERAGSNMMITSTRRNAPKGLSRSVSLSLANGGASGVVAAAAQGQSPTNSSGSSQTYSALPSPAFSTKTLDSTGAPEVREEIARARAARPLPPAPVSAGVAAQQMDTSLLPRHLPPTMTRADRATLEQDRIAAMASVLPANPKSWTPSQVAIYLSSILNLVPAPIVADVTTYVRSSHMGGKVFLRLREDDLEAEGLNVRWRKLMMECVRKLRRDLVKGRIWGFEGGSMPGSDESMGADPAVVRGGNTTSSSGSGAGSDEGVALAVQEAIAAWNKAGQHDVVSQSGFPSLGGAGGGGSQLLQHAPSSGQNRDTLKRLRAKKQIKGVIAAFEEAAGLPEFDDEDGFVAIGRCDGPADSPFKLGDAAEGEVSPSSRAKRELEEAYGGQEGWVRKRAASYSSMREEFNRAGGQETTDAAQTQSPKWDDTLSEDEAAALASELDQEELRRFADEITTIDDSVTRASAAHHQHHQADTSNDSSIEQLPPLTTSNLRRENSELSTASSSEPDEAATPDLAQALDPFDAAALGMEPRSKKQSAQLTEGLGLIGAVAAPSAQEVHIALAATAAQTSVSLTATRRRSAADRGSDYTEEELAAIRAAQAASAAAAGEDGAEEWDFSSPKFGTARRRPVRASPSPPVIEAVLRADEQNDVEAVAAVDLTIGGQGPTSEEQLEVAQMLQEPAADADSVRSMKHMLNMSAHAKQGSSPYGALSRRTSQRTAASVILGGDDQKPQQPIPSSQQQQPEEEETTVQPTKLADIAAGASEQPVLMTDEEVRLVESLGLSARSAGTLGSKRSKGVASLLRKQSGDLPEQRSGGAGGNFASMRSKTGSVRGAGVKTAMSMGRKAGGTAHSKMMALFDLPEVKTPTLAQESAFDEAEEEQQTTVATTDVTAHLAEVPSAPAVVIEEEAGDEQPPQYATSSSSKLRVPLYTIAPTADGKGSTKKRSMVLVDRQKFESLARRMGALEDQLAGLENAGSSPTVEGKPNSIQHVRELFAQSTTTTGEKPALVERGVQSEAEDEQEQQYDKDDEELDMDELLEQQAAKPMLSIGAIPSYMLGLGAGVGFVILSEVLGKLARR